MSSFITTILLCSFYQTQAQQSTLQIDSFTYNYVQGNTQRFELSKRFVLAESLKLYDDKNNQIIDSLYAFLAPNTIRIHSTESLKKSKHIYASYRFFLDPLPDSLSTNYKSSYEDYITQLEIEQEYNKQAYELPTGLEYSGSFSRGLTTGNKQSLVLESNFNMNLNGHIGNGIQVKASLSDANIPIQADGTTQQLQDFDQVYVELFKDKQRLQIGDLRMEHQDNHFLKFNKKLKGVQYEHQAIDLTNSELSAKASFAIAGGKYNRYKLNSTEGNQGPYILQGADNESYIIIQSGTEKIYMDGQLLKRGKNQDYVILYDRAQVIFTERQMITKDSRIIVEFEYLVQQYARTISSFQTRYTRSKHTLGFNMYREQDNKNSSGIYTLTNQEKQLLGEAGDDLTKQIKSGIYKNEAFNNYEVFYRIETNTVGDTILIHSNSPEVAKYQAVFTDLGMNKGSYAIDENSNQNKRIYKYVGTKLGRYEPIKKITAPAKNSMYLMSHKYNYAKKGELYTELSLSNQDKNLFSSLDAQDNTDIAGLLNWKHHWNLAKENYKHLWSSAAKFEYIRPNFSFINNFRQQEFDRDWNISNATLEKAIQLLSDIKLQWRTQATNQTAFNQNFNYNLSHYQRFKQYNGIRQAIVGSINWNRLLIEYNTSILNSKSPVQESRFIRPNTELRYLISEPLDIYLGGVHQAEYNNIKNSETTNLDSSSHSFDQYQVYLKTIQKKAIQVKFSYTTRTDRALLLQQLSPTFRARTMGSEIRWKAKAQLLHLNLKYRKLQPIRDTKPTSKPSALMLGAVDYQFRFWNNNIRGSSRLAFNSGQETKLEFDYIEVAPGEGNFIWIDNGDNIQQKHEFQPAPFKDQANYIQVRLYNNELAQIYKKSAVQRLHIAFLPWKNADNWWKRALAPWTLATNFRITRKDFQNEQIPDINLFNLELRDINLISHNRRFTQELYWNQSQAKFNFHMGYDKHSNSSLLTHGKEANLSEKFYGKIQKNIYRKLRLHFQSALDKNEYVNINFPSNNHLFVGGEIELGLSIRHKNNLASSITTKYIQKDNRKHIEAYKSYQIIGSIQYAWQEKMRLDFNTNYSHIQYLSAGNANVDFKILQGLQQGNNLLWSARMTRRIFKRFDLSIQYNGRKTARLKTVHVANMQIKANF